MVPKSNKLKFQTNFLKYEIGINQKRSVTNIKVKMKRTTYNFHIFSKNELEIYMSIMTIVFSGYVRYVSHKK